MGFSENLQNSVECLIFPPLAVYILQFCKHQFLNSSQLRVYFSKNCDTFSKRMASRLKLLAPNQLIAQVKLHLIEIQSVSKIFINF